MWTVIASPIGDLRLVASDGPATDRALRAIEFAPFVREDTALGRRRDDDPVLAEASRQLRAYFTGDITEFDLPLAPQGTEFQQRVWQQLRRITHGETASYGQVARWLGLTGAASRAVGHANGRNPIPIVIPCHRVIGANGSLTGYAGGLERKQTLLDLERGALF